MVRTLISLLVLPLCACSGDSAPVDTAPVDASPVDAAPVDATYDAPSADSTPADTFIDPGTIIAIDGLFDDWAGVAPRMIDAPGDASGAFDLQAVYALSRGTTIYLRFAHGSAKNLNNGPASEGTLAIQMSVEGASSLKIDLRKRTIFRDGDSENTLRWSEVSYRALPTIAAGEHELALDLATIGAVTGSEVQITFSGSDALDAPLSLRLDQLAQVAEARDPQRSTRAAFRLSSLNTYGDGLADGTRTPAFSRLFSAIDADIVCLQEEMATPSETITGSFPELPVGQSWHIQRATFHDTAIVSRWPSTPLPEGARFVGAGIDLPSGKKLVVYSFHPECCGYIGSVEDTRRMRQTQKLVDSIAALRDGMLGADLLRFADAPVIVAGDWNLVASGEPLRMLEAGDGPALSHWLLRHLVGNDIYTWRADTSSFPPGMLDLLVYDAAQLAPEKGFILDTSRLDNARLLEMGLERSDSAVTDHLALVADFRLE